jgi:hypothetical protein
LVEGNGTTEPHNKTHTSFDAKLLALGKGANNPPEVPDFGGRCLTVQQYQVAHLSIRRGAPMNPPQFVRSTLHPFLIPTNAENSGKSTYKLLKSDNLKMLVLPWPMFPVILPAHNNVGTSRRMIV